MRVGGVILLSACALTMVGARKTPYGHLDKAAYATQAIIDFLRPGLVITVTSGSIAADGTMSVAYTLTDPAGLPLDNAGVFTPGTISISYVAAYIPASSTQYTAYTTRVQTGTAGSFTNGGTDTGGVLTALGNGQYTYVFATKAPKGFDANATTTFGVYGRRTMTAYGIPNNMASTVFTFVPSGGKVTHVRDVVRTATCNGCHDQLSAHGGNRRQVELCILCHQPQSTDPATGNTVDFKVMVHKMHLGAELPSVLAGGTYKINNTDFSKVEYPATSSHSDATATSGFRCETCHDQKSGATQAANYVIPSRAACGSCHDNVNFATGVNHPGGFQADDTQCGQCHIPQGQNPFDASVKGAHTVPEDSDLLGGVQIAFTGVVNGVAGKAPTVNFTLKDKKGNALPYSSMASLTFVMAGPTTDYGYTSFGSNVTTPGYVTESGNATTVTCSTGGACSYTFTHAIPANATGTYAISFYGSRVAQVLLAGTTKQKTVTESPMNTVTYFSVDGSPVLNRRTVVQTAKCNVCHYSIELHGGSRRNVELCIMCHNPSTTDSPVRPNAVVAADKALPNQGVNFNLLVHRIHTGVNLAALGSSYTVVGYQGSHNDFSTTLYPAMGPTGQPTETRNCSMCHVNGSEQLLPVGKNAVTDPQGRINPVQAVTGACTGCHADLATASHAMSNTNSLGESCAICHKSTADFSIASQHAMY